MTLTVSTSAVASAYWITMYVRTPAIGTRTAGYAKTRQINRIQEDTLKTAISAMKELDQYKQLGTLEEVRMAVERLQPKPPNWHINPVMENGKLPVSMTCNTIMVRTEILGRTIDEHCVICGQAIDWSE